MKHFWLTEFACTLIVALISLTPVRAADNEANRVTVNLIGSTEPLIGTLVAVSDNAVTIREADASNREAQFVEIRGIEFAITPKFDLEPSYPAVHFVDHSVAIAKRLTSNDDNFTIHLSDDISVAAKSLQIDHCQLQKTTPTQESQWQVHLTTRVTGDLLSIVRSAESLDKIEGLIASLNSESIKFQFSGQEVDAPLAKLVGFRIFHSNQVSLAKTIAIVHDRFGGVWNASQLVFAPDTSTVAITTQAAVKVILPTSAITNIDFASASQRFLADLTPASRSALPRFELSTSIPGADKLFGPKAIRSGPKQLPSIEFLGSGEITFRVPEGFSRLEGEVSLVPRGRSFSPCRAEVLIEKATVWETRLEKIQASVPIQIDVTADQRVTLRVSPESTPPLGDVVLWHAVRFVK